MARNILTGPDAVKTCVEYLLKKDLALEKKLVVALQARELTGSPRRGKQSVALLTVRHQPFT